MVSIWPTTLHRYNANLPPSYRDAVVTEQVRLLAGIRALASYLLQSATTGPPAEAGAPNCEFYYRAVERDLAALEKGVARFLDLKYLLPPPDYPVLVRVFLQGIFTAGLDLGLRAKLSRITVRLIYRADCVLPFALPWRRIVVALRAVHLDAADGTPYIGKDVRDAHCRNLINLLRCVRLFVAASGDGAAADAAAASTAVQEIWAELTSGIDTSTAESTFLPLLLLSHVLPTRGDAWAGWVQPGAALWAKLDMSSEWDAVWLSLFSRLARHQPAVVDWTDYLPLVYDRILPCLQLPLGYAAPQSPVERRCPSHLSFLFSGKATVSAACFAIHALSPARPAAMAYLSRLLETARLYFHPSNGGRWTAYLTSFLGHLTGHLVSRLLGERAATQAGQMDRVVGSRFRSAVAPAEHRLTEADVTALRDILLPLIHQGMLAKSTYLAIQAAQSARDFAVLTPGEVLPPFLDLAAESLDSVSMPHRTAAGLKLLATLSPVFLDVRFFPPGLTALTNALDLTLPGIDPNDPGKTEATLRFIAVATSRVQSILTGDETGDGAEGEELARARVALAAYLEDYVHRLLDRLFSLLMTLEEPTKKGRRATSSSAPTLSNFVFAVTMQNLFAALPPAIALDAARKVARHVAAAAQSHARKYYGALMRSSAAAAASALSGHRRRDATYPAASDTIAADIFVPLLLRDVLELDDSSLGTQGAPMTDSAQPQSWKLSPLSEDETVWRVRMLAQTVRTVGPLRPQQLAQLRALAALVSHRTECSRSLYKAGGRLIRGLLEGLCATEVAFSPKNTRADGASVASDANGNDGVNGCTDSLRVYKSYNFDWQQPSPADWEAATQIVDDTLTDAEALIYGLPRRDLGGSGTTGDAPSPRVVSAAALSSVVVNRESLFRALRMIHAAQRGGRWLLAGGLADDVVAAQQRVDSAVAALSGASAGDDYDAVLFAAGREISVEDARAVLRAPIVAGVGGEQSRYAGAASHAGIDVARRLWVRAYGLVLLVIAAVMRSRPDDGALLYRCMEPIELANEPFRRGAGPARHSTLAARGYKSAYAPVMSALRPFEAEGGVGRLMPRFIAKMRIDALHEYRVSLSGRAGGGGGAACDAVFDGILHALCELAVNDFPLVRSEARGALTRALRVASHPARRHVIDQMLRVLQASSQGPTTGVLAPIPMARVIEQVAADKVCSFVRPGGDGVAGNADATGTKPAAASGDGPAVNGEGAPAAGAVSGSGTQAEDASPAANAEPAGADKKKEVSYEQMMGAADVLRSRAVSPLVMREWGFFAPAGKAVLAALLAAERPDAAAVVGGLFAKLAMLVRPLTLEDFALRPADFLSPTAGDASFGDDVRMFTGVPSADPDVAALHTFTDYTHFLLGLSKSGSTGVDVRAKPSDQLLAANAAESFRTMETVEDATSSVPIAPVAASKAVTVPAGDASGEPSSLMVHEARLTTSAVAVGPDAAPPSAAVGVLEAAAVSRSVVENKSASDAHWRLQSLVASTLYMGLRGERVTDPAVARLFTYGMVSDVVMLRQIACHAVALILALHVKRAAAGTIVQKGGQTGAHSASVLVSPLAGLAGRGDDGALEADAAEVEAVLLQPDFTRKLVHTLALDHSDEGGAGGRDKGHCLSLLSLSRYVDGDLCWSMTGGPPWPSSWMLRSRDAVSLARVRLYEGLMRVFGVAALDAFASVVDALLPTDGSNGDGIVGVTAENVRLVAAEVVAGMSRGLRYADAASLAEADDAAEPSAPAERHGRLASAADVERLAGWAWLLLERFSGPDGVDNGGTFIRLMASSARGRLGRLVGLRLADRILPPAGSVSDGGDASLLDQSAVAHVQARRLRYAHALVADAAPDSHSALVMRYVTAVANGLTTADSFGHPLKTVREEVARCMGVASSFSRPECRDVLLAAVDRLVRRLTELQQVINAAEAGTSAGDAGASADVEMTDAEPTAAGSAPKELSSSAIVNSEKTSTLEARKKQRSREGETLSRWVALVQWNGESHAFGPILGSLLPALFDSVDDVDQDRVDHARQALSLAAQARLDDADLSRVIARCVATAKSTKWRVRGSVLPYLQVVGFTRLFVGREGDMRSLLDAVVALLSDEQLDVREAAAHTLVPLLRDAPPAAVEELRASFLNRAKRSRKRVLRLRKVVRAERAAAIAAAGGSSGSSAVSDAGGSGGVAAAASSGPADLAAALVVQHGAVLGLGALLLSSPYAVPSWMPPVLLALTQCIDDMPPVSTTARKLFADFWRTHRDEWSAQREAFTADELEQVSEQLISPSYYA